MVIERCENVKIANLTITGGNAEDAACYGGGGIYICPPIPRYTGWEMTASIPVLENLIVTGNHAYAGGGISIWEQEGPSLTNIVISNNTATWLGGGIMIAASVATLTDVDIFENIATEGEGNWAPSGGGVFMDHGHALMENVNIYWKFWKFHIFWCGNPTINISIKNCWFAIFISHMNIFKPIQIIPAHTFNILF